MNRVCVPAAPSSAFCALVKNKFFKSDQTQERRRKRGGTHTHHSINEKVMPVFVFISTLYVYIYTIYEDWGRKPVLSTFFPIFSKNIIQKHFQFSMVDGIYVDIEPAKEV